MNIEKELFKLKDLKYKEFHARLMPTINSDLIIGVRIPALRKFAKDFSKTEESNVFLNSLPHKYYEENNLHAFLIEEIKDFDVALKETEKFLPYIDNWATCDSFFPKVFKNHKEEMAKKAYEWIDSGKTYTVRYGIGILMRLFLDEDFNVLYLKKVAEIKSEEYYIKMMIAWYFATALAKQYDYAHKYLLNNKLDLWTHNKTIQKAVESFRIPKETKEYLKTLKR